MLKVCLTVLLFSIPLFSIPSIAQVKEERLGSVIAMSRSYVFNEAKINESLQANAKQNQWSANVEEANDGADVTSYLKTADFSHRFENVIVTIIVKATGYTVHARHAAYQELKREEAIAAIQETFSTLGLAGKVHTVKFLKIER